MRGVKSKVVVEKSGKPGRGWLGRREMAEALGVSEQHFDRLYRPMLPKAASKLISHRWWFKAKIVFEIVMANKRGVDPDDEPAANDKLTPDDQRYRRAKAELAELELATRRREVVPMAELRDGLGRLAQVLKTCGEILGRDHGVAAQRVMEDALKTFKEEVRQTCGDR